MDNLPNTDLLLKTFAENLKRYRIEVHKESTQKFSSRIGVSRRTLIRMESGDGTVSILFWSRAFTIMNVHSQIAVASRSEVAILASMFMSAETAAPEWKK